MDTSHLAFVIGRGALAALFVLAGITKIVGPKPVLDHMAQEGVPKILFPGVIALELIAGGALLIGYHPALAASVLSVFCLATAAIFHRNFKERAERTQFSKDIALAGALALLAAL
jgi:putative oxidoreductase